MDEQEYIAQMNGIAEAEIECDMAEASQKICKKNCEHFDARSPEALEMPGHGTG